MSRRIKVTDQNKPWNRTRRKPRPYEIDSIEPAKVFLIVCEGVNTEPNYFKSFPVGNAKVESYGLGMSKTTLVEQVLAQCDRSEACEGKEVWVVFDLDRNPEQESQQKEDFNRAVTLAQTHEFEVAYSNDAFELWILLHFQDVTAAFTRQEIYDKLSHHLGLNYEAEAKRYAFTQRLYQLLQDHPNSDQTQAIACAQRGYLAQLDVPPADRNPCTTVYQLVEALNQYT